MRRRDYPSGPHLITQRLKSGEPIVASIREEDVKIEDQRDPTWKRGKKKNGLAVLGFEAGEMGPWAEEWKQPLEMERHRTHIFP